MVVILNRDAILGANDLPFEDVNVPEWGGSVRVRTMNGMERDEFRVAVADGAEGQTPMGLFEAAMLAACVVDEAGARVFSISDVAALRIKSAAVLDRVAAVAMRINGLAQGAQQEAAKNSESDQSADSGSASLSPSAEASASAS